MRDENALKSGMQDDLIVITRANPYASAGFSDQIFTRVDELTGIEANMPLQFNVTCQECNICKLESLTVEPDPDFNFASLPREPLEL